MTTGVVHVRDRGRPGPGPAAAGRGGRSPKAWTFLTTLVELKGHEEARGAGRPKGVEHGAEQGPDDAGWSAASRRRPSSASPSSPTCSSSAAARAGSPSAPGCASSASRRSSSTSTPGPATSGAAATSRSACTTRSGTTTCRTSSSPTTGRSSPPRTRSATGWSRTRKVMEIPYWSQHRGEVARRTRRRPASGPSQVERDGKPLTLRPQQLVLATGMSGKANVPDAARPGRLHRRPAPLLGTPRPGRVRRQEGAVVIGSNNSAFDICGALWEHGADVTMVQRSSTHIVKSDTLMEIGLGDLYSERAVAAGRDDREGGPDLRLGAVPDPARVPDPAVRRRCARRTRDFYDRLEKAGFELRLGRRTAPGLFMKYLRRGSGYYIDVGAAELVADGRGQARARPGRPPHRGRRWCSPTAPSCPPTSSSTPPATAR